MISSFGSLTLPLCRSSLFANLLHLSKTSVQSQTSAKSASIMEEPMRRKPEQDLPGLREQVRLGDPGSVLLYIVRIAH